MSNGKKYSYITAVLIAAAVLIFGPVSTALAGGWWQIDSSDTIGSGVWSAQDDNTGFSSPHGGFSSASNLCKTCHAVHLAGESSYRLLKDGSLTETRTQGEGTGTIQAVNGKGRSRSTECMYCHDANSGASSMKPYELATLPGKTVRGEHTLGVTDIPDSNVHNAGSDTGYLGYNDPAVGQGKVLQCWQCHSVHGANTIGTTSSVEPTKSYDSSDAVESWNTKILRLDPAGDGSVLAKGSGGMTEAAWQAELDSNPAAVKTGFCADCHNLNPNWEVDSNDTTRPNSRSHPQGPGIDSEMEVYGTTKTVAAHPLQRMGCRGCHYASRGAAGAGISRFPHQSSGWKLLFDEATMTASSVDLVGDPQRIIPGMDAVCLSCHAVFEDLKIVGGTGLCFNCHASKYAAPDISDETSKTYGMGITDITRDHSMEEGNPAAFSAPDNRHAECPDCHNAAKIYPWEDGPLTAIWGVSIDEMTEETNVAPNLEVTSEVGAQFELCFKCHATGTGWNLTLPDSNYYVDEAGDSLATENKAFAFNTKNSAFHPVRDQGRNQSEALKQQLETATNGLTYALSIDSMIKCTDCHNSDDTADANGPAANSAYRPNGPHGSDNPALLRGFYKTSVLAADSPTTYDSHNFELCFLCHDENKLVGSSGFATNFSQGLGSNDNLHRIHLVTLPVSGFRRVVCRRCHYNMHSNQEANNTEYKVWWSGDTTWTVYSEPPDGLKTRLINFAPEVTREPQVNPDTGDEIKAQWIVNLDNASHYNGLYVEIQPNERRCNLDCHVKYNAGTETWRDMSRSYQPDSSLDDDDLDY